MRKRSRIITTLIAISISAGIVLFLSYAGRKSKGPLENLVTTAGEAVQNVEQRIIINQRENKRADKLQWFNAYKTDSTLIHNPAKILLGSFDNMNRESYESSINLEDTLKTTFPLIHIYTAWGSKDDEQKTEKKT